MLKEPEAPRRQEPDENDTRPVSGKGDDRLLLWCLVASVFINFGFGLWMNLADVYGTGRTQQELKRTPLKIYHPPPVKKKPPPPKPKPKPKIPPKVLKIVPIKPPPTPPPPQHFTVGSKSTAKTAVVVEQAAPPAPPQKAEPVQQVTTPEPTPQITPPPTPPAPEVKVVPPPPPPSPPKPVRRPGYTDVTSQEAGPIGSYPTPDVPQDADVTTLHPCTVTWDVSESGRATNVRVTSRSGNSDLDDACRHAIEGMRFQPAIQDHYPQIQRMSYTWNFSG